MDIDPRDSLLQRAAGCASQLERIPFYKLVTSLPPYATLPYNMDKVFIFFAVYDSEPWPLLNHRFPLTHTTAGDFQMARKGMNGAILLIYLFSTARDLTILIELSTRPPYRSSTREWRTSTFRGSPVCGTFPGRTGRPPNSHRTAQRSMRLMTAERLHRSCTGTRRSAADSTWSSWTP